MNGALALPAGVQLSDAPIAGGFVVADASAGTELYRTLTADELATQQAAVAAAAAAAALPIAPPPPSVVDALNAITAAPDFATAQKNVAALITPADPTTPV